MRHLLLAYIDAGTGSMILQAAIAALVAVPIILRSQISRAIQVVRSRIGRRTVGPDVDAGSD
jgi:hypothetical protein